MLHNLTDPNDFFPYAESITDFGICVPNEANGMGLTTRGLIWQAYDVWFDVTVGQNLTTTWSAVSSQSVTTTWTDSQGGVFGELPP